MGRVGGASCILFGVAKEGRGVVKGKETNEATVGVREEGIGYKRACERDASREVKMLCYASEKRN